MLSKLCTKLMPQRRKQMWVNSEQVGQVPGGLESTSLRKTFGANWKEVAPEEREYPV